MRLAVLTLVLASVSWGTLEAKPAHHRHRSTAAAANVHTVRRGETADKIAKANGLSLQQLESLNPGRNLAHLSIGAQLKLRAAAPVRVAKAKPAEAEARESEAAAPETGTVVLAKGESLYALAKAHDLTVAELMDANPGLNPRRIRAGARLNLPATAATLEALPAIPEREAKLARMDALLPRDPGQASESEDLTAQLQPVVGGAPADEAPVLPAFQPADRDHLDLLWPVETREVSSAWGPRMRTRVVRVRNRRKKRVRYRGRHKGIDLPAPMHTDIYAALDGVVVFAGKARGYGTLITVDHGNGVTTMYGHESLTLVHEGDIVRRGEKIAEVGRAGNATGPHLHFELRLDGVAQNPLPVLDDTEEIPAELAAQNATVGSAYHRK